MDYLRRASRVSRLERVRTVSYTHLDVYKRQLCVCVCACARACVRACVRAHSHKSTTDSLVHRGWVEWATGLSFCMLRLIGSLIICEGEHKSVGGLALIINTHAAVDLAKRRCFSPTASVLPMTNYANSSVRSFPKMVTITVDSSPRKICFTCVCFSLLFEVNYFENENGRAASLFGGFHALSAPLPTVIAPPNLISSLLPTRMCVDKVWQWQSMIRSLQRHTDLRAVSHRY